MMITLIPFQTDDNPSSHYNNYDFLSVFNLILHAMEFNEKYQISDP